MTKPLSHRPFARKTWDEGQEVTVDGQTLTVLGPGPMAASVWAYAGEDLLAAVVVKKETKTRAARVVSYSPPAAGFWDALLAAETVVRTVSTTERSVFGAGHDVVRESEEHAVHLAGCACPVRSYGVRAVSTDRVVSTRSFGLMPDLVARAVQGLPEVRSLASCLHAHNLLAAPVAA